jgi:PAS domain S-box-containing protein
MAQNLVRDSGGAEYTTIMNPLIVNLLAGSLLLLSAVHLFRVIARQQNNSATATFWLAPTSLLLFGFERLLSLFLPPGDLLGNSILLVASILLVIGLWHWMPPQWWQDLEQNATLGKQLAANRRMTTDAWIKLVHSHSRIRELEFLEQRLTEQMYKALHATGNAMIVLDRAGTIIRWDSTATSIFGYENSEIVDHPFGDLIGDEKQITAWQTEWNRLAKRRTQIVSNWTRLRGKRKNDTRFTFEIYPMKVSGEGDRAYYLALLRDLSEIEALNSTIERYRQLVIDQRRQLKESLESEQRLEHRLTMIKHLWHRIKGRIDAREQSPQRRGGGQQRDGMEMPVEIASISELTGLTDGYGADEKREAFDLISALAKDLVIHSRIDKGGSATTAKSEAARVEGSSIDHGETENSSSDRATGSKAANQNEQWHDEDLVTFHSIGPARYVLLESFGKSTRYNKSKGMSLMVMQHGDNLVIALNRHLGKLPERALIPLSSLTLSAHSDGQHHH